MHFLPCPPISHTTLLISVATMLIVLVLRMLTGSEAKESSCDAAHFSKINVRRIDGIFKSRWVGDQFGRTSEQS
jgi:hypothetical protein